MGKCIVTLHYVVEVANEVANVGITLVIWGYPTSYLFNMLLVWPQSKFYVNNCMEWCCVFTFVCWEMLFYCVNNTQVFPSTDWETKQGILTWRHNLCHRWKNGHALNLSVLPPERSLNSGGLFMLFCLFLIFYKSTSSANIIFFFLLILAYCFAFSRLPLAGFLNSATFQKMTVVELCRC